MRPAALLAAAALAAGCAKAPPPAAPVAVAPPPPKPVVAVPPPQDPRPAEENVEKPADGKKSTSYRAPWDLSPPKPAAGSLEAGLAVPEGGGTWPWNLRPATAARGDLVPTPLPRRGVGRPDVNGIAVDEAAGQAVVLSKKIDGDRGPVLLWADLVAGKVADSWPVPDYKFGGQAELLGFRADSGRVLFQQGGDAATNTLDLWTVKPGGVMTNRKWKAACTDGSRLHWAGFAGTDRIVTATKTGEVSVWHASTLARVAVFYGQRCQPGVTPDGSHVVTLAAGGLVLIDPTAAKVAGVRRTADPPADPVIAVRADGGKVALVGANVLTVFDTRTGATTRHPVSDLSPRPYDGGRDMTPLRPAVAWVDDTHLYADPYLIDPALPMPAWEYRDMAGKLVVGGRRAWAVASKEHHEDGWKLAGFVLPHAGYREALAKTDNKKGAFLLRPGGAVSVDVAGVPAGQRLAVRAKLIRLLQLAGYEYDAGAKAVLAASEDSVGRPASAAYLLGFSRTYQYRPCKLALVVGGKVEWEAEAATPPPQYATPTSSFAGVGDPDYTLFDRAEPPKFVRGSLIGAEFSRGTGGLFLPK